MCMNIIRKLCVQVFIFCCFTAGIVTSFCSLPVDIFIISYFHIFIFSYFHIFTFSYFHIFTFSFFWYFLVRKNYYNTNKNIKLCHNYFIFYFSGVSLYCILLPQSYQKSFCFVIFLEIVDDFEGCFVCEKYSTNLYYLGIF